MKPAKFIFLFVAILFLVAAETAWSAAKQSINSADLMEIIDLDGDGRIDIKEYRYRITDVYFFLDADKDGKLTVAEIQRGLPDVDPAVIAKADVNNDTTIDIYEFRYVLYKDFDVLDKNMDGSLDQQELKAALEEG